jgi:hypothetical protein
MVLQYCIQNKYVVTNTLSYEKSFGRHNLSGVVGSTYEQNDVIEATVEASDFASDLQLNVTSVLRRQQLTLELIIPD